MSIKIGVGFGIPYAKGGAGWSSFWASLISATVEDANPDQIVLTFPLSASLTTADFTVLVNGVNRAVSSASWAGGVLTLTLASDVVGEDIVTVSLKGLTPITVTNNVLQSELTTYITGLATPLSAGQITKLNTLIASIKAGTSIMKLEDAFDIMYLLAGETEESSLKNLVKNSHHVTEVNAPVWTQYEGLKGDAISMYGNCNYNPSSQKVALTTTRGSIGSYQRVHLMGYKTDIGSDSGASHRLYLMPFRQMLGVEPISISGINSDYITGKLPSSTSVGFLIVSRTADNVNEHIKNGVNIYTDPEPVVAGNYNNYAMTILATRGATEYSNGQVSFCFIGKDLSVTQAQAISTAIEIYMDSNGKGVF